MNSNIDISQLRKQLRETRRLLSAEQQQDHALQALDHLKAFLSTTLKMQIDRPLNIALFLAQDGELQTQPAIEYLWQTDQFKVYLPVLETHSDWHMAFAHYHCDSLMINNRFKIHEPSEPHKLHLNGQQLNIVLMPLVGFDSQGNRVGMGGGYYDRTFEFKRTEPKQSNQTLLIGWAHSCQQVSVLDPQDWDVPLDGVITEKGFVSFRNELTI
ncbi:MAG: 5-formyltetrahydrofolate cyclo-ligase [Thiomicrorhabdus sp.]|nr:MAG: 5-formyltetrahydrofolate cyclo-ligase [Thiomicrorhabdus sp.]